MYMYMYMYSVYCICKCICICTVYVYNLGWCEIALFAELQFAAARGS